MKVKVCGITSFEQMQQLQDLGADYAGMIFYEKSKRYIGSLTESEKEKINSLSIKRIGVFVNAEYETILKTCYSHLLHGGKDDGMHSVFLHHPSQYHHLRRTAY